MINDLGTTVAKRAQLPILLRNVGSADRLEPVALVAHRLDDLRDPVR
jgi:hypothetical protein